MLAGNAAVSVEDLRQECISALRLDSENDLTEEHLSAWDKLRQEALTASSVSRAALRRVPTGATRSALDHVEAAKQNIDVKDAPMGSWALDHLLYAGERALELDSVWATLEDDPQLAGSLRGGLPDACVPTDHLPVMAAFRVISASGTGLTEEARKKLLERKMELLKTEKAEDDGLGKQLALEEEKLLAAERAKQATVAGEGGAENNGGYPESGAEKKKKQKAEAKNAKPSEAVIALKRASRERMKALKATQSQRRAEFVAGLSTVEADVVEDSLGCIKGGDRALALAEWVEMLS
eukprot:gnl/TRDRNA2_/TRDRNA2_170688_c2_seq1.p2 gnl/TRDRNA2_/TRDRNA2_170688_c2~~gnl/TRDRNA2_/TRDRNA2_170688_c2_seq1.p2  ORF type:complete len:295 (+),score=67.00 gnl/TRDRNA2_/TRDRNA2_170688_c2_seq1:41-925(+)